MNVISEIYNFCKKYLDDEKEEIIKQSENLKNFTLSLSMGSGKTFLSLMIFMNKYLNSNNVDYDINVLLVLSKSLIQNWEFEIKKFFPNLTYEIFSQKTQSNLKNKSMITMITPEKLIKNEMKEKVFCLIIDEAHEYTRYKTKICQSLINIDSEYRILLSGTIFNEPKVDRILGYFKILKDPNFPDTIEDARNYVSSRNFKGIGHTLIKNKVEKKYDFEIEKIIIEHELSTEEEEIHKKIKNLLDKYTNYSILYNNDKEMKKKMTKYILSIIIILRQCIVIPQYIISNIKEKDSELNKTFSDFFKYVNVDSLYSSRIRKIGDTISDIFDSNKGKKILIFSCFKKSLDILHDYIMTKKSCNDCDLFCLKSEMSAKKRGDIISNIRDNNKKSILLTTYDIGAEGLNLQFANIVILVDFWWNSGKTKQAIARSARLGQLSEKVYVYFFVSNTSIENALFLKQEDKINCLNNIDSGPIDDNIKSSKINDILGLVEEGKNGKILCRFAS